MNSSFLRKYELTMLNENISHNIFVIRQKLQNKENLKPDWHLQELEVVQNCIKCFIEIGPELVLNFVILIPEFNEKLFDMFKLKQDLAQLTSTNHFNCQ